MPYSAQGILRINPITDDVRVIGNFHEGYKWHGGAVGGDGSIYAMPSHSETILRITPPLLSQPFSDDNPQVVIEELSVSNADQGAMKGNYKSIVRGMCSAFLQIPPLF